MNASSLSAWVNLRVQPPPHERTLSVNPLHGLDGGLLYGSSLSRLTALVLNRTRKRDVHRVLLGGGALTAMEPVVCCEAP